MANKMADKVFGITITITDGIAVMSIDLGCEWMKIAVVSPGKPMEIAMNKESLRKTPVAVSFRNGERLIGDAAMSTVIHDIYSPEIPCAREMRKLAKVYAMAKVVVPLGVGVTEQNSHILCSVHVMVFPENTYHHFLDLLGKSIDHPEVKRFQKRFPHHKMSSVPERNTVFFHHKENIDFTPEELLAMVLTKAQEIAQDFTEQKITDCVITVPPYFNQGERRAVIDAARFAGLKVLQLINSNVAAALNYGVFRRKDFNATPQNIMLYDMGAANTVATIFSYQVVKTKEAGYVEENPQVSVKGMGYDRTLGGLEMQLRLRDHLANLFNDQKKTSTDVFTSPQALSKLFKEAGLLEDIDFKAKVTREDFMKLISDVLEKVNNPIQMALEDAGMTMNHIEQLILVGGGTRVPKIQELLLEFSKKDLGKNLNTDEAPALGAAYQAAYLSTGFKVKTFAVRDSNLYPIQAHFSREIEKEDSVKEIRQIKRMLFSHQNPYPQKKVMTFNKHVDDFNFFINYGELDFLPEDLRQVDMSNISKIKIKGVKNVLSKHNEEDTESKGIKAHFRMDESGILHLDKVYPTPTQNIIHYELSPSDPLLDQEISEDEIISALAESRGSSPPELDGISYTFLKNNQEVVETEFKKKMAVEEEPSTLSKIGSTISNLFSGSKEEEKAGEEIEKNDKPTDTEANKTKV
ncbi:Hypoxia up-regulated protein 1 [Nymphon striatum]|nr:Hypoxia up-regulated protein 1 [Nymphon striatum]